MNCREMIEEYLEAYTNWFIRYGELGHFATAVDAYMKQKHRMIWERSNPDKVDFMYARNRQADKYSLPIEKGQVQSPQLADNSRTKYQSGQET